MRSAGVHTSFKPKRLVVSEGTMTRKDPEALRVGRVAAVLGACLLLAQSGCNLNKVEVPALSGPSELALSFYVTARPDVLTADGRSTSAIQVTVRNQNGQPVSGQELTFALTDDGGNFADIGTLSSPSAVTGAGGIAQIIYRSPARTDATANRLIQVVVRPVGGDARGQVYRAVTIELRSAEPRLFPQIPGNVAPKCSFVIEPGTGIGRVNQSFLFQSTSSDSDGTIVRYEWDFGDGVTDDKPDVEHRYAFPDDYTVVHVVTDNGGAQKACSVIVTVE